MKHPQSLLRAHRDIVNDLFLVQRPGHRQGGRQSARSGEPICFRQSASIPRLRNSRARILQDGIFSTSASRRRRLQAEWIGMGICTARELQGIFSEFRLQHVARFQLVLHWIDTAGSCHLRKVDRAVYSPNWPSEFEELHTHVQNGGLAGCFQRARQRTSLALASVWDRRADPFLCSQAWEKGAATRVEYCRAG